MLLTVSVRRVTRLLGTVFLALVAAGTIAEYGRLVTGSESVPVRLFSLSMEKNIPTFWSSFLLLSCSAVLFAIVATKKHGRGEFRAHWIGLAVIFLYLSMDELIEIHEYLSMVPGLGQLHGLVYYGWVIPASFVVLIFAMSYLRFLFHLPKSTRFKVAMAGVVYVGGAVGIELWLGAWSDRHGEFDFIWFMIGLVQEAMEMIGSSLFLVALLDYLGRTAPDLHVAIISGRDLREGTLMADSPASIPSWTRSPWLKWSWLALLVVIVAQSLSYQWRALPTTATGYSSRGMADFSNDEYESAAQNFAQSISRQPNEAEWYLWRGLSYAQLQELGKAMADLEKAVRLKPNYPRAYSARGDGRAAAWDAQGAVQSYSRALELDPEYGRCFLHRGLIFYDQGKWGDSVADLRRAASLLTDDRRITAYLAVWLARAHAGEARGASVELSGVMEAGEIRGDRFWMSAQFLTGQIPEATYLEAMPKIRDGVEHELVAESRLLAGVKRLVFGDRAGAAPLLQAALATEATGSYAYDRARVELERLLLGFHAKWTETSDTELVVASVDPDGAAHAAGVRPGWRLTAIGGTDASQDAMIEFLTTAEPDSNLALQFVDGAGERVTVPIVLRPDFSEPTK